MRQNRLAMMLAGCSAMVLSTAAFAQTADTAGVDEIVVTGSRIVRNGYQAPTPVAVVQTEELALGAPTNIADGLRNLPQFNGGFGQTGASGPTNSLFLTNTNPPSTGNYLDLRGLGAQRMLVLIDGRRVPPTTFVGTVDINIIPQALVQRVDVVTAGASAVYGSDAVSGVVNFVLDTKFTGVKGVVSAGQSEYGDADNVKGSIAAGMPFANGRGHVLVSAEHYFNTGVKHRYDRPYLNVADHPYFLAGQGTAADPYRTIYDARNVQYTRGGLITAAVNLAGTSVPASGLIGQQFLNANTISPLQYGTTIGNASFRQGGEGSTGTPSGTGASTLRNDTGFLRIGYDLTDSITAFLQASVGESRNRYTGNFDSKGGVSALTIYTGNAYLPAAVQATMTANGVDRFTFARQLLDFPGYKSDVLNNSGSVTGGFEGRAGLFGMDLNWDAYYTHGEGRIRASQVQNENRNLFAAVDAVVNPANGQVVCRVTLTNPGIFPGCIPINLFGDGTPSAAAIDFISDVSRYQVVNKLDELAGNIGGSPFSTWAGPVSFNLGANYRKQSLVETSNANPAIPTDFTGIRGVSGNRARFGFTNTGVADGEYTVKEAYAETVVPLLTDMPFAQLLEFNGAGRYTDYSTSGGVWTWKAGLSFQPIPDIRIRATRSKDIRAPTLYDLFAGRDLGLQSFTDTGRTNLTQIFTQYTGGNPNLKPEVSKTTSLGVIFQPSFLPGFQASIDYYDVKIRDAISNISSAAARDECLVNRSSPLCDLFVRPLGATDNSAANFPTSFFATGVNIASLQVRGVDFEVSYNTELSTIAESLPGHLGVRALIGYVPKYATNAGAGARTLEAAGTAGRQKWNGTVSANYEVGPLGLFLQSRIIGAAVRDTPENTGFIYLDGELPAQAYFDATVSYKIEVGGKTFTPFITVNNLANKKALLVATTFLPNVPVPTLPVYDYIGRRYTAGIRFNF